MELNELVNKCVNKNTDAWNLLYRRYKVFIFKCVQYKIRKSGITPPDFSANDITQEIFHAIWKYDKLNTDHLKTWLSIFSINFTKNYLRKHYYQKRSTVSFDTIIDPENLTTLKDFVPDNKADIISEIDFNELYAFILNKINDLPKKQKIAIKLNILFQKKHIDISRIMNLPVPTVSSLILRSKNKIKKNLFFYFKAKKD